MIMYNAAVLLDMHERGQRTLQKLLRHCAELSPEEFERELPGFGYPSVRLQLEHIIGAEEYWLSVVQGTYGGGDESTSCPSVAALEAYRAQVAKVTDEYLSQASEAELNTPRDMRTWQDKARSLVPARIIVRTQTHIYQHQGQVMAMCRLLGRPGPAGLDYPLD
jgi:uncharacterized damage-inducible protein DinB